jgi:hypothetical protein
MMPIYWQNSIDFLPPPWYGPTHSLRAIFYKNQSVVPSDQEIGLLSMQFHTREMEEPDKPTD